MSDSGRPKKDLTRSAKRPPIWKKVLFAVVACVAVLLVIEGLLAVVGVQPVRYATDPYVGFSGRLPLFVRDGDMMVTAENKRRIFNYQQFPAKKGKDAYRIFCIGGSTTYGHPYTDSTSFCGWLRAMLPKADPSRQWELINCGGISYASYREALLMEELANYKPDLFIILTGHNEFLEDRTYGEIIRTPEAVRGADAILSKTRTYAALKRGIDAVRKKEPRPASATNLLSAEVDTVLDHTVGPQAYHRDETLRKNVLDHFRFNIARMTDIARSAGAKVILVTSAANVRDCAPFKSEHRAGMSAAEADEWEKLVWHATQQLRMTNWAEAVVALERAVRIDPQFADEYYFLGHALWEMSRFDEARAQFLRALNEDVCPLRALPEMVSAMREVAEQRRVELVDFVQLLESKSPHAVPGEDWFLDHVHPTIEGHRVLALKIIDQMSKRGWRRLSSDWNATAQEEIRRHVESTLTPKDHGVALCTLAKVIAWAGKGPEAYRLALRARALAPGDPAVHFEVGKNAAHIGRKAEAIASLKAALGLQPNFAEAKCLLGPLLMDAGQSEEAVRMAREAVALQRGDVRMRLVLADVLSRAKRVDDAAAECREALRIAPNYPEAHNNLAWFLKDQGRCSEALQHFREAVRLRPGSVPAMMGLAWLLATHPDPHLRDTHEAVRLAQRVVDLSPPENWMAWDTLGVAYAASGRFSEAEKAVGKALERARAISPKDAGAVESRLALYQAGTAFTESGDAR